MDISAFADEDFDEKEWINKIFKSSEAQENKDVFVGNLVKKLQVYVQQVNHALEDTSQKVLQSLPRVVRDTEVLHQEAVLLRDKMQVVKMEIAKAEQETGQSMAALEKVDRVKAELQAAKQALHEADNWTILASDLEEKFEAGDLDGVCEKVVSMQQCLQVLAQAPDFEDRRLQLEGLKNRLEAMASTLLVHAFNNASVEESRRFVRVFSSIERLPQLLKYHHKCQEESLLTIWRDLAEMEGEEGPGDCLRRVYDALLASWHQQAKWCAQVFAPTPALSLLLPLFSDLLVALSPSLRACVGAALSHEDPLSALADLRQVTRHFSSNLQASVENLSSQGEPPSSDSVLALAQAVHAPWVVAVQRYGELEKPGLAKSLRHLQQEGKSDPSAEEMQEGGEEVADKVQALVQVGAKVLEVTSESVARCSRLTEDCGTPSLVQAIQEHLLALCCLHRSLLRELEKRKGPKEDWGLFQTCLAMLQAAGELTRQTRQLENQLASSLQQLTKRLSAAAPSSSGSPFLQSDQLLLTPEGRTALHDLMAMANQIDGGEILEGSLTEMDQLCRDAHTTAVSVIFSPISSHLQEMDGEHQPWRSSGLSYADLPDFSYSPQEYITQVGQYLMTLPQHLEPFLLRDNPAVGVALAVVGGGEGVGEGGAAEVLLGTIASATSQAYCDHLMSIEKISPTGAKQLATDINYLGNVMEDLGLRLSEPLLQACQLLRLSPEEYQVGSTGCSPRLVAAIRQMRNLTSA